MKTPLVAIVGRPNVGKSTLVNRIVGRRAAIVEERPGVTRDRRELDADWSGRAFRVVDTGGWVPSGEEATGIVTIDVAVSRQAERALAEADVVVMVVDAAVGVTDADEAIARLLRGQDVPVVLGANKVDDTARELDLWQFDRLGLGAVHGVSALHGRGSGELLDAIVAALPASEDAEGAPVEGAQVEEERASGELRVAIVGRPNVGKSTLFNRLVGDERTIVHDLPGTTRDAIDTVVETPDGPIRFVDTAGMRRPANVEVGTEHYSVLRALEAVDRADAALLVVDAHEGVTHQDQRLAERVDGAGTAVVVVLNKWDAVDPERKDDVFVDVADRLGFLGYAPVLRVSGHTGRNVDSLLPALREAESAYHARVPTAELNRVLRDAQTRHPPPAVGRHRPRVLYGTQGATDPPTFTLFATRRLPQTYLRYLERRLREDLELGPTPLKVRVRVKGKS